MKSIIKQYACPCCGNKTLSEIDAYEICDICGWEDDPAQRKDPHLVGGANRESLFQARVKWQRKEL